MSSVERRPKRILVVDDDPDFRVLVAAALEGQGYQVRPCSTGDRALSILERDSFDLILADMKMPRVSGLDLLDYVRRQSLATEVILITGHASVQTAVQALRGDAFDYLVKPCSLQDLRQAVHRALHPESTRDRSRGVRRYHDLALDRSARQAWIGGHELELTRLEFDLLAYLFDHQGHPVSCEELLQQVWPGEGNAATVKSCVWRLRRKLGDDAREPRYILNVWGVGYQLGY